MEQPQRLVYERARRDTQEAVMNRLALVSTLIWAASVLAFVLVVLLVLNLTNVRRPVWLLGGFAMFVPAALPWLYYRHMVEEGIRRRVATEMAKLPDHGATSAETAAPGSDSLVADQPDTRK